MEIGYLLSPVIQIEDINGLPLVGGRIKVFRHGTTIPYITYRDFDGNRNPAEVILDGKGMCILIADSGLSYDIYCEDRYHVEQWSRLNVCTIGSGHGDSTEALEWFRGEGYSVYGESDIYVPIRADGNMDVADDGIRVHGNRYYHITAHLSAIREAAAPYYDSFDVRIVGESEHPQDIAGQHFTIDWSMGLVQDFEISTDFMAKEDGTIRFYVEGVGEYGAVSLVDVEVHRVYSGVSEVPGHLLTREEADGRYQGTLTEGRGIRIDQNNVISITGDMGAQSDWWVNDTESPSFIRHKPDLSVYATQTQVSALTAQLATLSNTVEQLSGAVSTMQSQISFVVQQLNSITGQVGTNTSNIGNLTTRYNSHGNNYDPDSHRISHLL